MPLTGMRFFHRRPALPPSFLELFSDFAALERGPESAQLNFSALEGGDMKRTAEKMDALGKAVRGLAISIVVLLAAAAITEHVSTLPSAQASPSVQAQADATARAAD